MNARDALPHGGPLVITTREDQHSTPDTTASPVRVARLTVSDTGCGMTEEVRKHVFEPFFTTKGPDRGTGLGLATVFGIVQQTNGWIEVETAPGAGATFRIDLPTCDPPLNQFATISTRERATPRAPASGRSVLLVEDEDCVRKFTRFALEAGGYQVTEAADGETALAVASGAPRIDLLVTDLTMPGMDGCELAARLLVTRPRIGVVVTSGYLPDTSVIDGVPGAIFLPKPFTPADLLRTVGDAVAQLATDERPGTDLHRRVAVPVPALSRQVENE